LRGGQLRKNLRRALIAALLVGCASVIVAYRLGARHGGVPVQAPETLPEDAQQAASGYSFTRSEGPNLVFTVRAQRTVKFEGSRGTTLEGVEVEIFGRKDDQHDLLTTKSCEYNSDSGDFSCAGPVKIELNAPRSGESAPARTGNSSASSTAAAHRQPIYLETSHLTYNQQRSIAATAAPVKWRYGPASGSAVGLTYATRDGCIELHRQVEASWPVKGASAPSVLKLTAGHLRYAKEEQRIEMAGPVDVTDGGRRLDAQHAIVYLDAQDRLTGALFDGGVTGSDPSADSRLSAQAASLQVELDPLSGELRQLDASGSVHAELNRRPTSGATTLTADHVHVGFEGAHFHPDQGFAAGNVRLTSDPVSTLNAAAATPNPSPGSLRSKELNAGEVHFAFHLADGTLDRANTVGAGKLILVPASAEEGKRVVTAGEFHMAFDRQGRLTDLRGLAPTRIVFEPAEKAKTGTVAMESLADNLEAKLNPASEALKSLRQSGRYQLFDGDRQAIADQADYSADENALTLTGKPVLRDPETRMTADRFVLQLATNSAEGYGHVSSTYFGPLTESGLSHQAELKDSASSPASAISTGFRREAAEEDGTPRSLPSGRDADPDASSETTNVLADRVTADRGSQAVHYEGHVRAWRGTDVLEAPSLDIYRVARRIVAAHGVVTSDLAPAAPRTGAGQNSDPASGAAIRGRPGSKAASAVTQPVTVRADRLEYLERGRTAAYRGHVRMDHGGATLEADRLDAYFSKAIPGQPSELERAVANGSVTVVEPGRRATGNHAEYFAASGKVELSGGPPTLYDAQNGFTTGRVLTFFTRDDTVQVDGGEGSRALTKHHLSR